MAAEKLRAKGEVSLSLVSQKSSVYRIKLWDPEVQMLLIAEF